MASKRKKIDTESSPDKTELILTKPLNNCGKCGKKCLSKGESIQCDLCGTWAHANCENITRDQYKAITSLSSLNNLVYYCHSHDCINRVKSIISDWIKANGTSEIKEVVTGLTQQYLSSEHSALQKAVSDLSSRIDKLQAQELELTSEIKNTSKALETHPESIRSQNSNRKSNIVIFGVEESPPKTPKSTRLQKDTSTVVEIFSSLGVHVESSHILDCFRLGKFKVQQSKPRPILVKFHRIIDATSILANKASLSSPIFIKPDMSPAELAVESILLKERWALIQGGHNRKSIRINSSNSSIYVNNQVFGKVINSKFQRSNNYQSTVPTSNQQTDSDHSPQPMEGHESSVTLSPAVNKKSSQ